MQKRQEIDSLLELAYQATADVDTEASMKIALNALRASKEIAYPAGIARACFYTGQALYYLGNYEKSLEYLSLSEKEEYTQNH